MRRCVLFCLLTMAGCASTTIVDFTHDPDAGDSSVGLAPPDASSADGAVGVDRDASPIDAPNADVDRAPEAAVDAGPDAPAAIICGLPPQAPGTATDCMAQSTNCACAGGRDGFVVACRAESGDGWLAASNCAETAPANGLRWGCCTGPVCVRASSNDGTTCGHVVGYPVAYQCSLEPDGGFTIVPPPPDGGHCNYYQVENIWCCPQ